MPRENRLDLVPLVKTSRYPGFRPYSSSLLIKTFQNRSGNLRKCSKFLYQEAPNSGLCKIGELQPRKPNVKSGLDHDLQTHTPGASKKMGKILSSSTITLSANIQTKVRSRYSVKGVLGHSLLLVPSILSDPFVLFACHQWARKRDQKESDWGKELKKKGKGTSGDGKQQGRTMVTNGRATQKWGRARK